MTKSGEVGGHKIQFSLPNKVLPKIVPYSTGISDSGLKCLKISSTGYIDIRLNLKFLKILK